MLKNGLAALLIGLILFGGIPAYSAATSETCAMSGSDCCCGSTCPCPVKDGNSCASCIREKSNPALLPIQETAKPRVSIALYFLPKGDPTHAPAFARASRNLNTSPPSSGPAHQALLRVWLV